VKKANVDGRSGPRDRKLYYASRMCRGDSLRKKLSRHSCLDGLVGRGGGKQFWS